MFEIIHCDIGGPFKVSSSCGAYYFLSVVDDFSRGVWIYMMKEKRETGKLLKNFVVMVKTQFDKVVKILRSDNGSEFKSGAMKEFYASHGMVHQTSCVDNPQQNGRVERKHRHLLNVARALRFQANLPLQFWGECVLTVAYLINRTPSRLLKGKLPMSWSLVRFLLMIMLRSLGACASLRTFLRNKTNSHLRVGSVYLLAIPLEKKGGGCMT